MSDQTQKPANDNGAENITGVNPAANKPEPAPTAKRFGYVYTGVATCALLLVAGATYMYTPYARLLYDDINVYLGGESHYQPTPVPDAYYWARMTPVPRQLGWRTNAAPSARSAPAMSAPQPAARQWERIEMAELAPARETAREMA
ncbi:MAG: hypothetical protein LBR29_06545, partial [Methylobacteriaceae bacterium]|nr:hypothetical protein [Methylobacteriaceae bacterium]